jgi:aryl-alcohol dehydrogenase-like predicted oxidoreductase
MQYRRLGRTQFMAGEVGIGLGALRGLPADEAAEVIRAAVAAGVNVVEVDTRNEAEVSALAAVLRPVRTQLIVTGAGNGDRAATEAVLAALGLDHFDCYLAADATARGDVQALAAAGLTRMAGLAADGPAEALAAILDGGVDVVQVALSALELRQPSGVDAVLTAAQHAGVGVLACSPLAGGRLLDDARAIEALSALTDGPVRSVAQGAIAWALSEPRIASVISGPRSAEQARENAEASRAAPLAADLLARVASGLGEG